MAVVVAAAAAAAINPVTSIGSSGVAYGRAGETVSS